MAAVEGLMYFLALGTIMQIKAINLQVYIIKNGRIGFLRRAQMLLPQRAHKLELANLQMNPFVASLLI